MQRNYSLLRSRKNISIMLALVTSVVFVIGCAKEKGTQLGVPIPEQAAEVELASVIEKPADYNGKTIVMKGIISGQCASLCEFFFKDGVHKATTFPQGYKFPKLTKGKPVTVYAQVTAGEGQVVFSALGVKVE
ncbi:MAG: hypothetical protein GF344_05160 [Chitinivibrionales bacterium]|nr:hypothetical protein [Chitinivibrionales bacterium]MBD3356386.1 hypothetical protein [Chitinivibrionales bacterium]